MWRSLSLRWPRDSNRLATTSLRVSRLPDKRTDVSSQQASSCAQFLPSSYPNLQLAPGVCTALIV